MKMKILQTILMSAFLTLSVIAEENMVELLSFHSATAPDLETFYEFKYSVPMTKLKSQPEYDPQKGTIPLSIDGAIKIAQGSISEELSNIRIDEVILKSHNRYIQTPPKPRYYYWFYSVKLHCLKDNSAYGYQTIVVLLDGTIVEPTKKISNQHLPVREIRN